MISPEDYQRAYEHFCELRAQDAERRRAALERLRADDPPMAGIVERLLASDGRDDGPIDRLALGDAFNLEEVMARASRHRSLIGAHISRYHLRRIIASGGMGTVYEAAQENPRRTVAVKVLRDVGAGDGARRRFDDEAQILARLRHPGIAQIFEAGTHEDAASGERMPYFVMEHVPGARPITTYAREEGLGTRERLELFRRVCEAVHHGHQKGVIHRDLKPSNILVDANGEPKIIDFGVARCTDADVAVTTLRTDVGQLIGTLQYMSPEQCEADPHDLDTRSDVYALGVVLFELLCEQLPYDVTRAAIHEAVAVVREATPVRPSSVNRTLRGDVETITLKALEKERERRYQSVLDLSQDITRYLAHETILARPPSVAYQLRKFARRHRVAAAALIGVAATLILGIAGTSWQAVRATRAEEAALTEAARAGAVIELLTGMLSSADPDETRGPDYTVRQLLDEFAAGLGGRLEDEPDVQATLRRTIGEAYLGLGLPEAAEEQLNAARELQGRDRDELDPSVLRIRRGLIEVLHDRGKYAEAERDVRDVLERIDGRADLAELRRDFRSDYADLARHLGRYEEAESLYRELLEARRRDLGEEDPATLTAIGSLANLLVSRGRPAEAESLYREALPIMRRVLGETHPDTLGVMRNLAAVVGDQGRYSEAGSLLDTVVASSTEALGTEHPLTLSSMKALADVHRQRGRYESAESLHREVLEIRTRAQGAVHPDTLRSMVSVANVCAERGRYDEAERLYARALAHRREVLGDEHPDTLGTMNNLAMVYHRQDRRTEAEGLYLEILPIQRRVLGEQHPKSLRTMCNLAWLYLTQRRYDDAEPLYIEALDGWRRALGEEATETLRTMHQLATLYAAQRRLQKAEPLYEQTLRTQQRVLPEGHPETLTTMHGLADLYRAQGRLDEAAELSEQTLATMRRTLGDAHPSTLTAMHSLGLLCKQLGRMQRAEALLREALAGRKRALGEEHRNTLGTMTDLGNFYADTGRLAEGEALLDTSVEAKRRILGIEHPWTRTAMRGLAGVYDAQDRPEEARSLRAELLEFEVTRARSSGADAATINSVAWTLLTTEHEDLRDPDTALTLAERAAEGTDHLDPAILDTLALAQHRTGDTAAAVQTQRRAVALMPEGADPEMAERLAAYEAALQAGPARAADDRDH